MKTGLFDLVEFRWSVDKKVFVKVATHLTNQPKQLCYYKKRKLETTGSNILTRYKIVPNGELQYSNSFSRVA